MAGEKIMKQLKMEVSSSIEDEGEKLFYETIEAPKFVDFTRPNHFCPDDRYWFCSRVGCDRKHEEEIDSEAIYKDFVLRVMAARSPNVRLRKALTRRPPSETKKCPLSAPPKPSKSRLPKLALAASISKKLIDDEKGRTKHAVANPTTPKARVKHVAAKYMTSPRNKKRGSPNRNAFRSVRNPKRTSITIPKNKGVAKALFNSPRKALKAKPSEELATPVTKLCQGIKKLQITSQKKGTIQKPSKECRSNRKMLPSDGSRRKPSASCKAKTRQDDLPHSRIRKSKTKQKSGKKGESELHEAKGADDSSDMEIDEKCRAGSLENSSAMSGLRTEKGSEGNSRVEGSSTSQDENTSSSGASERPQTGGTSDAISSHGLTSEMISSEDKNSVPESAVAFEKPDAVDQSTAKKESAAEDDLENQNPSVVHEFTDNDDKENASNSNDIRNLNGGNLRKHDIPVKRKIKTMQNKQTVDKTLKENFSAGNGTQGVKYRKLKPTNPKPFRLRTDERGILKESTLDRKTNSHENATTASDNSQCTGNGAYENSQREGSKDGDRKSKREQPAYQRPTKSKYKISPKEGEPKSQKQLAMPQREIVSDNKSERLGAAEETTATMLKPKQSRMLSKVVVNPTKASVAHKLAAHKRRPTVPREPNFHSLHKPKSCTKTEQSVC